MSQPRPTALRPRAGRIRTDLLVLTPAVLLMSAMLADMTSYFNQYITAMNATVGAAQEAASLPNHASHEQVLHTAHDATHRRFAAAGMPSPVTITTYHTNTPLPTLQVQTTVAVRPLFRWVTLSPRSITYDTLMPVH